jgi:ribonuclease R
MASLPNDFWIHDEASQSLIGKHSRLRFQLAQSIEVRLSEARPVTGGLIFSIISPNGAPAEQLLGRFKSNATRSKRRR